MATKSRTTDAPKRCDVVDEKLDGRPAPIDLCQFMARKSVAETIAQTARYAKDPRTYLETTLGLDVVENRADLLCIPGKVDRDVYGSGEYKTHVQQHIAKLLAQLSSLKIHCEQAGNNRVAWHVTSHLESAEQRSFKKLFGLDRRLLGSTSEENPTVDEIKEALSLPADQRPAAIVLEVPNRVLGCKTYTFAELEEVSTACQQAGVRFHLDGARLWEIEPYYQKTAGKTFADIGRLFDSVYLSFYKGLRGVAGAVLAHNDEDFINEAKVWQRRAGGNATTLMYEVTDCERGYNENIGTFKWKWAKMSEIVDGIASATHRFKTNDGEQIVQFLPEKATCCQIITVFRGYTMEELTAARDRVEEKTNVRVFDRLQAKKTLDEQSKNERAHKAEPNGDFVEASEPIRCHAIEWMINPQNESIENDVFVNQYFALCEELGATNGSN